MKQVYLLNSFLFVALLSLFSLSIKTNADMLDTEELKPWEVCAMCHGLWGTSAVAKFPNLAGQKKQYLKQQIMDFKSGKRTNDGGQMQTMVEQLTAEQIKAITEYFSAQKIELAKVEVDKKLWLLGKDIYFTKGKTEASCSECHNPVTANAIPKLFGQKQQYLVKQMNDFIAGDREPVAIMQAQLNTLNKQQIEAVAHYLSTQTTD